MRCRTGSESMRRAGRIIFQLAATMSLLMLVFLAWLSLGMGRDVHFKQFGAWGYPPNITLEAVNFSGKSRLRRWAWQGVQLTISNERRFAYFQTPRWLAPSLPAVLPSLLLVPSA